MTPLDHVVAIGQVLDSLSVPWVLGGSLASSLVGEPRSTMDIDVAVALEIDQIDELVAVVEGDYYVSAEMAREAVVRHSSFNLIHFESGMKIDLFPLSDDPLDVRQLAGRELVEVEPVRSCVGPRRVGRSWKRWRSADVGVATDYVDRCSDGWNWPTR